MTIHLETACFTNDSAVKAAACHVDRIELCERYDLGGITPNNQLIEQVEELIKPSSIQLMIMIRPRGGHFVYTNEEFWQLKRSIIENKHRATGFVFGILTQQNEVDEARTAELVHTASPLPCTFHRAFDIVNNKTEALEVVIATGCRVILTSGGLGNALQNRRMLAELVSRADGRVDIITGGGIRSSNLSEILSAVQSEWYHTSALNNDDELIDVDELQSIQAILRSKKTEMTG